MFNYNDFYKTQDAMFCAHPERHALVASLCHGRVADIGCCMGILSDYYSGPYVGYDFADSALDKARDVRRKDAEFVNHDCSDLSGIPIEKYDTFVFAEFLEHFVDDDKMLGPIFARHKQGARIIVTTPNGDRVPDPSHLRELTIPMLRKKFSPYGRVKFYNWGGAKRQIIMTIDLGEPARDLLSLVMIVKNEALGLENAILSAIDIVDNVVVAVDNSTTDGTVKIANRYADTVKMFTWSDDFSAARNFAQEGINTKWIMFLDGHEYLKACPNLDLFLQSEADGLLCTVEMDDGSVIRNPRIFKSYVKFKGAIHEQQQCRSVEKYIDFIVKHDRLGSQSKESAHARSLQSDDMVPRIMGEQLKKNPKNIRASFHLALHAQARNNFKKAIAFQRLYFKYSTVKSERWFMYFQRAHCQFALRHPFFAMNSLYKAEKECPDRWEVKKMFGIINFYLKRYERAIEFFVQSFEQNVGDQTYKPWPRDDSATFNLIGECHFHLGEYWKAHVSFCRASELATKDGFKKLFKKRADLMLKMSEIK